MRVTILKFFPSSPEDDRMERFFSSLSFDMPTRREIKSIFPPWCPTAPSEAGSADPPLPIMTINLNLFEVFPLLIDKRFLLSRC